MTGIDILAGSLKDASVALLINELNALWQRASNRAPDNEGYAAIESEMSPRLSMAMKGA